MSPGSAKRRRHPVAKVKGGWTPEEDAELVRLVHEYGEGNWSPIAKALNEAFDKTNENGRIGKQCRERWNHHLRPDIKKDAWTEEEEVLLVAAHKSLGNKWSDIARQLPGRTENAVKNHWNACLRRKDTSHVPDGAPQVLRTYMLSLGLLGSAGRPGRSRKRKARDSSMDSFDPAWQPYSWAGEPAAGGGGSSAAVTSSGEVGKGGRRPARATSKRLCSSSRRERAATGDASDSDGSDTSSTVSNGQGSSECGTSVRVPAAGGSVQTMPAEANNNDVPAAAAVSADARLRRCSTYTSLALAQTRTVANPVVAAAAMLKREPADAAEPAGTAALTAGGVQAGDTAGLGPRRSSSGTRGGLPYCGSSADLSTARRDWTVGRTGSSRCLAAPAGAVGDVAAAAGPGGYMPPPLHATFSSSSSMGSQARPHGGVRGADPQLAAVAAAGGGAGAKGAVADDDTPRGPRGPAAAAAALGSCQPVAAVALHPVQPQAAAFSSGDPSGQAPPQPQHNAAAAAALKPVAALPVAEVASQPAVFPSGDLDATLAWVESMEQEPGLFDDLIEPKVPEVPKELDQVLTQQLLQCCGSTASHQAQDSELLLGTATPRGPRADAADLLLPHACSSTQLSSYTAAAAAAAALMPARHGSMQQLDGTAVSSGPQVLCGAAGMVLMEQHATAAAASDVAAYNPGQGYPGSSTMPLPREHFYSSSAAAVAASQGPMAPGVSSGGSPVSSPVMPEVVVRVAQGPLPSMHQLLALLAAPLPPSHAPGRYVEVSTFTSKGPQCVCGAKLCQQLRLRGLVPCSDTSTALSEEDLVFGLPDSSNAITSITDALVKDVSTLLSQLCWGVKARAGVGRVVVCMRLGGAVSSQETSLVLACTGASGPAASAAVHGLVEQLALVYG